MRLNRFERGLPWSGVVAAVAWVAHDSLGKYASTDDPGAASVEVMNAHTAGNHASQGLLVVMGISLLFFATATRAILRSGESAESTFSSIAYAGWVATVAAIAQLVVVGWALLNGAADGGDQDAAHVLGYVKFFGWAGMGIGLATAFIATGCGGLTGGLLPRWFSITSIVLGILGALGNAGIPPGGLVTYLLLPVWLVTASIIMARSQRAATRSDALPIAAAH